MTTEFITEAYYSGGLANYLHRVGKALVAAGHEVHVITYSDGEPQDFIHNGLWVHRAGDEPGERWLNRIMRYRLPHTARWMGFAIEAYKTLRRIHRETPVDFVQYPNYLTPGLFASRLLTIPSAVRISSYSPMWERAARAEESRDSRALAWLEKRYLTASRHVYAPSQILAGVIEKEMDKTHVPVIRPPFEIELPQSEWDDSFYERHLAGKDYLLYFGRFQPSKGIHVLIDALPAILERFPEMTVALIGNDSGSIDIASYQTFARQHLADYSDRVIIEDALPHAQLYKVIHCSRLVVLPSLVDNLPNACLEAMGLGRPVVGTRGASFEELIDPGISGFLVPLGEVEPLVECLKSAWHHPELAKLGLNAQKTIEKFALAHTIPQLVAYYEAIITNSTSGKMN